MLLLSLMTSAFKRKRKGLLEREMKKTIASIVERQVIFATTAPTMALCAITARNQDTIEVIVGPGEAEELVVQVLGSEGEEEEVVEREEANKQEKEVIEEEAATTLLSATTASISPPPNCGFSA